MQVVKHFQTTPPKNTKPLYISTTQQLFSNHLSLSPKHPVHYHGVNVHGHVFYLYSERKNSSTLRRPPIFPPNIRSPHIGRKTILSPIIIKQNISLYIPPIQPSRSREYISSLAIYLRPSYRAQTIFCIFLRGRT